MQYVKRCLIASIVALLFAPVAMAQQGGGQKIQVDGNQNVFPESVTSTRDGTIFTSSVGVGQVFRATPNAKEATAWTEKQPNGPQSILGVYADERSGTLWACYSDMAWIQGRTGKPAILRAIDLDSGKVKQSYPLPAASFCNDIVTMADNTAYITDTHGGRILQLKPGSNQLVTWFQDGRLKGVDGIAFGDEHTLYVTNVNHDELFKLAIGADGKPGELLKLAISEKIKGPDALRRTDSGEFFLAENKAGKVDQVTFDGSKAKIHTIHGGYQGPTSMTATKGKLYVSEAKIHQYGKAKNESPFYVYELPLPSAG